MNEVAYRLAEHNFKHLFIEVLGWDHASGTIALDIDNRNYDLSIIAQKRGLPILHCPADHTTLYNRGRLRRIQRKLAAQYHEHVVIYTCNVPRKQVWQWAVRLEDGRRLRHREHPFFSEAPPSRLLDRLNFLRFSLDEEEDITFVEALARVRNVLDTKADFHLFVNKPWYAQRSDELAEAVEKGGQAELHEFLEFHLPLVRWAVRPYVNFYHGDLEDAEQTGTMGLIHAARHFDRSRGAQFSTYAIHCIRGYCKRGIARWYLPIRLPQHMIWPCLTLQKTLGMIAVAGGQVAVRKYLDNLASTDPGLLDDWLQYDRIANMRSLSDRHEPERLAAYNLPEPTSLMPSQIMLNSELRALIRQCVGRLEKRDTAFVLLKYGFDGEKQTLEEIGQTYGLTRERVRQRLVKSCERLKTFLTPYVDHSFCQTNDVAQEINETKGE